MRNKSNGAFTLIELIIGIAIITLLTSVVAFNFNGSNDALVVASAGQEMALAIRQAQVNGLSVKESGVSSGIFDYAYGAYFNTSSGQNTGYIVFIDKCSAGLQAVYDIGASCGNGATEKIESVTMRNSVKISSIAICTSAGSCSTPSNAVAVSISFKRPNTDAAINFMNSTGSVVSASASNAKITLISPKGKTYAVTVDRTGQILTQ